MGVRRTAGLDGVGVDKGVAVIFGWVLEEVDLNGERFGSLRVG